MKNRTVQLVAMLSLLGSCGVFFASPREAVSQDQPPLTGAARYGAPASGAPYAAGAVLVAFHPKASQSVRLQSVQRLALTQDLKRSSPHFARLLLPPRAAASASGVKEALAALRRDPAVRVAEPDYTVRALGIPNDSQFASLWGMNNTGQTGGTADADIDAPEAWDVITGGTTVVAVIDTGVDYNHPDLTDNILRTGGGTVIGYDYVNNDADPMDDNNHGTHCAGTIGGRGNNGFGVAGVCHTVRMMPLKFLDAAGNGNTGAAIQCIDFARLNGAQIMSNSWGGGPYSQLLLEAIQRARDAGILFLAAAGNDGTSNDELPHYPSNYNNASSNVLSVGASNHNDVLAGISNYGASVDLAAPGQDILSTTRGNTYSTFTGTSMATPHVAGAAALLLARFPGMSMEALKLRLLASVDYPAGMAGRVATGRLNVNNSLESDSTPPGMPTNLRVTHRTSSGLLLRWTASGDDGATGAASRYELRYSQTPITPATFASAQAAVGLPVPVASGGDQEFLLPGLDAGRTYHLALRAVDNVGNVSELATTGPWTTVSVVCYLEDDVEGTLRFSGPAPWASTTEDSFSPTRSYSDSPGAPYATNLNSALTQADPVTPTATSLLTFRVRTDLEVSFDYLRVEVSGNGGGSWSELLTLNGSQGWTQYQLPLAAYAGLSTKVRFRLTTDDSVALNGVWLDDIRICESALTCILSDNVEGTPQFTGSAPWSVTTEDRVSPTRSYTDSPGSAYANNLNLSLTQQSSADATGLGQLELSFQARLDLESGFDFLVVEVSTNGGSNWTQKAAYSGVIAWKPYRAPLPTTGSGLKVRFRLTTDDSVTQSGVWLDDIQICGEPLSAITNAPAVQANKTVTVAEDAPNTPLGITAPSDPDGDSFTIAVTSVPDAAKGVVRLVGGGAVVANGQTLTTAQLTGLEFDPAANANGAAGAFAYSVTDVNGGVAAQTVTLAITPVNDAPSAGAQSASTNEDTAKTITLAATDVDGDSLTYSVVASPTNGTLSGAAPNLTYTPNANYNGDDSFTFKATDGTADSNTATVSITVNVVNDPPVVQADKSVTVNEDAANTALAISAPTDPEGDSFTITVITVPNAAKGSVRLSGGGAVVSASQTLTSVQLTALEYDPAANANGAAGAFTYNVADVNGAAAGQTVTLAITAVNDAPSAAGQSVSTNEDTAKAITLSGADIDGDALTYSVVAAPTNGVLSGAAPNLTYTPNANYNGPDSFTFKANDTTADSNTATVSITVDAVNDAPVAAPQSVSAMQETEKQITLAATDAEGSGLTYSIVASPMHGTLMGAPPSVTYLPALGYFGADSFTFKANDGTVDSNTATVSITVARTNDAPVAGPQNVSTNEDTAKPITLAATDGDGDGLTYSVVASPTNGTLSGTAPNLTYTPNADYNGPDSFTFKANDGAADSNTAAISITVNPVSDAPIAAPQSVSTNEDTAKAITLSATDADGDSLTYTVVASPTNGTLSGTAPNVTYTPNADYNGPDSFTFKANDGATDGNTATVSITVNAVNDAPVAADQDVSTNEDAVKPITLSAADVDGDDLTYSIVASPLHGMLTGTAPNIMYTPAPNYNGPDSFTFKANDGAVDSNTATVTITVVAQNDSPVAQANKTVTVIEDAANTVLAISAPTDPEGDSLTITVTAVPNAAKGSVRLSGGGAVVGTSQSLTSAQLTALEFDPAANANGPAGAFTYTVSDGNGGAAGQTVTLAITPVNDLPVAAGQSVSTNEDAAKAIILAAADADGDGLTYSIVAAPTNGVLSGAAPNVTYTPAANYSGPDSFTFRANDGTGNSNTATVSIAVNPVNDAPVAAPQNVSATEDTPKALTLAATDADGDSLTYSVVASPTNGMLSGAAPNLTYTPAANYSGPDSFTFRANDGTVDGDTATVSITVGAVSDAPVAGPQNVIATEDAAKAITLSATDADGDSLTYSIVASPIHGVLSGAAPNVTYTPAPNYNGPDSFTFKASDGALDSNIATIAITVSPANDAPSAANQGASTNEDTPRSITLSATDLDGDALTYSVVAAPMHGVLTGAAPNLTYTPAANYSGTDSFTFKANDGALDSNTATVTLSLNGFNDAPMATAQTVTTAEDTPKPITLEGSDVDGDSLTFNLVTAPMHGTVSGSPPNLTFTPAANYNGPDSFTFKVSDGVADSSTATVTLNVTAVNDAPAAVADAYSTLQSTTLVVAAPGVLANDTDVDGDPFSAELVSDPTHGVLILQPNGGFTYTPEVGFSGADTFSYRASDGSGMSGATTVTLNVGGVPTSTPGAKVTGAGSVTVNGVKVRFKVKASFTRRLTGSFSFADRDPARKVKKAVLTAVVVSGRHARIFGTATLGNRTTVPFVADLDDPVAGAGVDRFGFVLGSGLSIPISPVTGKVTIKP